MADSHYKVKKFPKQKKWGVYDRKTGKRVATSTRSKHAARVYAHIRGDNSKKYN